MNANSSTVQDTPQIGHLLMVFIIINITFNFSTNIQRKRHCAKYQNKTGKTCLFQ